MVPSHALTGVLVETKAVILIKLKEFSHALTGVLVETGILANAV